MKRLLRWVSHHLSGVLSPSGRGACVTRAREGTYTHTTRPCLRGNVTSLQNEFGHLIEEMEIHNAVNEPPVVTLRFVRQLTDKEREDVATRFAQVFGDDVVFA